MPWTAQNQADAKARNAEFSAEFNQAYEAWRNAVQSGQPAQTEAAMEDVLRRWREYSEQLRTQSDMAVANQGAMDALAAAVQRLQEQRSELEALQSEATTRGEQASSLNPKTRASPYTNILGLQRIFKAPTRTGILIATIVFAVLALGVLGFLVYQVVVSGQLAPASYVASGGARAKFSRGG
jgi:hypothetical protein